jgi:hypothetical protein
MEENQKSIDGIIERLALIADGLEELFPEGTIAVALELKNDEFKKVQKNFRTIDHSHKQFKIDLSGVEFMFLLNESSTDDVDNS